MDVIAIQPKVRPIPALVVDPVEARPAARRAVRRRQRIAAERAERRTWWKEVTDCLPQGWVWKLPLAGAVGYLALVVIMVSL